MRQQIEIHEQERANLEKRLLEKDRQLHELKGQLLLRSKDKNHQEAARKGENIKLAWREGKKAPFAYKRFCDDCFAAVLPNNQLMVVGGEGKINDKWTFLDSVVFGSLI